MNFNRNLQRLWALLLIGLLMLSGCGGDVSQTGGADELSAPAEELALLPRVSAGNRQFADSNVLIALQGSVQAAEGAEIVRILWTQTHGPEVAIPRPRALNNVVVVPDVTSLTRLEFRLAAEDSEGKINFATTSIYVKPQLSLVRVLGSIVPVGDLEAIFTLRLSSSATEIVSVFYRTQSGTALADVDFIPVSGTLEFLPGEISKEIRVSLLQRTLDLEDRIFALLVSHVQDGNAFASSGVAVILGDDPVDETLDNTLIASAIRFNALVGVNGTGVNFIDDASGFQFIRARDGDCNITDITQCEFGQAEILTGADVIDTAATLSNDAYYWLEYDGYQSDALNVVVTSDGDRIDAPPARFEHQLLAFDGRLWLLGGETIDDLGNQQVFDDVWSSMDGISWLRTAGSVTGSAELFSGLSKAELYNNELWVHDDNSDGIYRSADGSTWNNHAAPPPAPRHNHQLVAFRDQLLLQGDSESGVELLSYTEALGWIDLSAELSFSSVESAQVIVFNDRLWMIGPVLDSVLTNPTGIWYSEDGIVWVPQLSSDKTFSEHYEHQLAVFNNRLWLIGGYSPDTNLINASEIWSTADGVSWTLETQAPGFAPRTDFQVTVFNDKLWLHGGWDNSQETGPTRVDTWVTADGIDWKRVYRGTIHFPEPESEEAAAVAE